MARVPLGASVPPLPVHLVPTVEAIDADFIAETNGRERIDASTTDDMLRAAEIFVRRRLPSLDVIRKTDPDARRIFASDIRDIDRIAFPDIQLILQLMSHFSPPPS